jgi:hypothetical protein
MEKAIMRCKHCDSSDTEINPALLPTIRQNNRERQMKTGAALADIDESNLWKCNSCRRTFPAQNQESASPPVLMCVHCGSPGLHSFVASRPRPKNDEKDKETVDYVFACDRCRTERVWGYFTR